MKSDIEAVLIKADPKLARAIAAVIAKNGIQRIEARRATPFQALVRAVVYQSVSTKAAAVIFKRLEDKVGRPMTPANDLTGSFCTRRNVRNRLGKEFGDAEKEVQRGADRNVASPD